MDGDRFVWYVEHRLEFLRNRKANLKASLEGEANPAFSFEALREFLEVTGRIRELEGLLEKASSWL